ncbi:MAG: DUF1501 domain-containing protein [Planctomycetota bacterium JB042]
MTADRSAPVPPDVRTRREFLTSGARGVGSLALGALLGEAAAAGGNAHAPKPPHFAPRAKRVLYLHMAGSPSSLDLFDPKPALVKHDGQAAPRELVENERFAFIQGTPKLLGSPFEFARHGASGQVLSELLPRLGSVADELLIVRNMRTTQFNHAPAQMLLNTGHERIGRPSMGSWLSYGLGTPNRDLPAFVVLLSGRYQPSAGASAWSSGFLPSVHQGVRLRSRGDAVLFLSDPEGVDRATRRRALDALRRLNERHHERVGDPEIETRIEQYELAYRMQASVPELLSIEDEPEAVREAYGVRPGEVSYANNCLLARRLLERGVRFVQLYHWGWDSHGTGKGDDLLHSLRERCLETDGPTAALLADLRRRGLLDDTIVVWGGEFGRTPMNEERHGSKYLGRDHHPHAFTIWMAGAGVRAGHTIGATDELGYHVDGDAIEVHDLHATMLHLLGLDHERFTYRHQGRDFRLTDVAGRVVGEMLA